MDDPVEKALTIIGRRTISPANQDTYPITINFHPDLTAGNSTVIGLIAQHRTYRSQFETGTSSGGLTAHPGGDRWNWESQIFGQAYDDEHPNIRPKYGALNYRRNPLGASIRFGSAHFRLAPHVISRTSFCYPDSYLQPKNFALCDTSSLIAMAEANELDLEPWLDNYIEAHIHGVINIREDVEAIVLDPSFQNTEIEESANLLGCSVEWHTGFRLGVEHYTDCELFRGATAAAAIKLIAEEDVVTPAILWRARDKLLNYQTAKWVWHCIARYGQT